MHIITMWFFLVFQALLNAGGIYQVKAASGYYTWGFVAGALVFGLGVSVWFYMLRVYPISILIPLSGAIGMVLAQLMGVFWFNETLNWVQITGTVFIVLGMALVSAFAKI